MNSLQMSSEMVPLAQRLPWIDREAARLVNAAYGAALPADVRGSIFLQQAQAFENTGLSMRIDADGARIDLSLIAGSVPFALEGASQAGLPQELLVTLAEAECAEPLRLLERVIGAPLTLVSVALPEHPTRGAPAQPPLHAPIFGWWHWTGLASSPAAFALRCVDAASMASLSAALERRPSLPDRAIADGLPLELALVADAGFAVAADLARLLPGEAVMLAAEKRSARPGLTTTLRAAPGRRTACPPILARGCVRGRHFEIEKVLSMNDRTDPMPPDAELAATHAHEIEVEVRCELARLSMSLADIARLAPGMVLDLQSPLEGMRGTLRAGGRIVGRGEIVVLGDGIALRLTDVPAA